MRTNRTTIIVFALLIIASALYRVWDNRPLGFAPQIAMALFAGSVIANKRFAFLVPLLSMLVSDALYQVLYMQGLTDIRGFYQGQWVNYVLFSFVTVIGFFIKRNKFTSILAGSLAGVLFYFVASNFANWIGGGLDINNQPYPKTWEGLMACYVAALPFLKGSLWATLAFNAIFFGGHYLYERTWKPQPA
ncbi:MAG TPA: DUF6580 family putative transport protein [Chitinophagaceae bacterium]|nr:DUF6580 family putative transport protein [Chitinophagaceae bacterium]